MLRFLTDEDFDNNILRGMLREAPEIDVLRVQDANLAGAHDADVLEWAAQNERIVLTHDVNTMIGHAYERVRNGQPMPGLMVVPQGFPIGQAIQDMILIAVCCRAEECRGQVKYLPL